MTPRPHSASDTYGSGLVAVCLLFTMVAFIYDDDNGWLILITAVAGVVIAALPGALTCALAIRRAPHGRRVALSLLGMSLLAGMARMSLATLAGAVGAFTLVYVMGLAVLRHVRARGGNRPSGPSVDAS